MRTNRIGRLIAGVALIAATASASGQAPYPTRPIRVIVPYPAGGIVDIVARSVSEGVGKVFRQPMVVEAKPGANSNIGTAEVARSTPDGYTWLVTGPAVLVNPSIYKDAGWNALRDFKCVGLLVWNQSAAVVPVAMPVNTLKEFVELAKASPGKMNFGNPGIGSSIDLTAKNLFRTAGIDVANIGYKGQPQALIDLITGEIQITVASLALALPHIRDGKLKALAVFTKERVKELPDVPTVAEAGYPDAAYLPWYGIYVPAATPDELVKRIHDAVDAALQAPEVIERLSHADIPGQPMPLEQLAELMKADHQRLTEIVKVSHIAVQ
ncbi:MAG TPA: tripartite tricarboxylate transporter substrate binding protein [Bradyrhizobium sp.]|nr:tripartite tricarboxylate transporter substrate binding protein [Bradyrhizobium sp.]